MTRGGRWQATLDPGDGVGPAITAAAAQIVMATGIPIESDAPIAGPAYSGTDAICAAR